MEFFITYLLGVTSSWFVGHYFFNKTPEWATELFNNLPKEKPSKKELITLFQKYLDDGEAVVDTITGYVACPECGEPAENFTDKAHYPDDYNVVAEVGCPNCGWKTYEPM